MTRAALDKFAAIEQKIDDLQLQVMRMEEQIEKLARLSNMQTEMNDGFIKMFDELNKR